MWIWILVIFVVLGAILGAMSDDGKGGGCLAGAFMGLLEGGSCLLQLLIMLALIAFACWIFS